MKRHVQLVVGLFGLIELLCPRSVVAVATRLAYRAPDSLEIREWVYTAARIEGAAFVLLALFGLYRSSDRSEESKGSIDGSGRCSVCRIVGGSVGRLTGDSDESPAGGSTD